MEQHQQEERQSSAHEFQAALDELEEMLQANPTPDKTTSGLSTGSLSDAQLYAEDEDLASIDLEAFEDAVADIEKYLAEHTK